MSYRNVGVCERVPVYDHSLYVSAFVVNEILITLQTTLYNIASSLQLRTMNVIMLTTNVRVIDL